MNIPVTRTKILLPRRPPHLLTRKRLLDIVYELLDYRLIIVAAPAGYGKTSLLVDLAHRVEMPVCWYALDPLDQDPQCFVAHLIGAIAQRFPEFGKKSSVALQNTTAPDLDVDRMVSTVVNEAYERIREHFVLVLDDYHIVGDCEIINRFISQFAQKVDENCHLVLSSRTLLSLPDLPLMVARSQVGGLAFGDLAFRTDEIQALMLQNYHLTMPESEAERLEQETEGWITGLLLSAQTMWQGMADRVRLGRVSGVGLYDYLVQQVLDQQPAPVRDFLLRTSPMEEFDATLCRAVLGRDQDWQHMVATLLRSNLFVLPVESGGTWLRYHHLFRDFLQARLAQEQPDEQERILRRLVAVFAERQEWEKAHQVCQRLGNVQVMADLIEQSGSPLIKNGRWRTLAGWLDALPAGVMSSRAALLSLRGDAAVMLGQTAQGLALLNQAEVSLRKVGDAPLLARTLVRRATAHRLLGEYQTSLADADAALALAERDEHLRAVEAEAIRLKGLGLRRLGRLPDAINCLKQSMAIYATLGNEENVALIQIDLGMVFRAIGECEQAESAYNDALGYWRRVDDIGHQASVLNNLGFLYYFRGNYEQAGSFLEESLALARQSGFARTEALALTSIGDLYADLDALEAAHEVYCQARLIAQRIQDRFLLLYLDLSDAALARSKADLLSARGMLESARQLAEGSDSAYEQGLYELEVGRTLQSEGNLSQAIVHLEKAAQFFQDGGQRAEGARAWLYLANACYQTHTADKTAFAHLARAFDLATNPESKHVLVVAGRDVKPLLEFGHDKPIIGFEASRLLQRVIQFEQDIPAWRRRLRRQAIAVPFAPPRLTFKALGRIEVVVGERPVTGTDWQAQVARDLLFCLLAHPNGMTKDAVGSIFWQEHTPAQLKLQFKQTIYRVRRALGQDVVLLDQDRYRFNRSLDYEFDVDTFWSKLDQAHRTSDLAERAAALKAAVDLYQGPYLPDIDGIWIYSERERLWQAYVDAILELTEYHLAAREYETALDYAQRVLAEDPCLEQAHRLVMRIHASTGNRAGVIRQWERCRTALSEEANAPLSPETETLYERLTRR